MGDDGRAAVGDQLAKSLLSGRGRLTDISRAVELSVRKSGRFGDFRSSFGRLHAKAATIDRRWLYIGSMNLDPRSARANTEVGLVLDSPPLATDAVKLLGRDGYSSMYRLRLSEDDKRVEWVSTDINGDETVSTSEPHDSWRLLLQRWLLSPLALEDLL